VENEKTAKVLRDFKRLGKAARAKYNQSTWIDGVFYKLSTLSSYASSGNQRIKLIEIYETIAFNCGVNDMYKSIEMISSFDEILLHRVLLSFLEGFYSKEQKGGEENE